MIFAIADHFDQLQYGQNNFDRPYSMKRFSIDFICLDRMTLSRFAIFTIKLVINVEQNANSLILLNNSKDGELIEDLVVYFSRPYPMATTGRPHKLSFDIRSNNIFFLLFLNVAQNYFGLRYNLACFCVQRVVCVRAKQSDASSLALPV